MEQKSTVPEYPPAPFQMNRIPPPPEAPAWPWAELGPQKPASAWCTMPSNHNRGRWLNLLCIAFKKNQPTQLLSG